MNMRKSTFSVMQAAALAMIASVMLLFTGFDVKADAPVVTMNAETVTLTDENMEFELEAVSSDPLSSVEWFCSDRSVVTWNSTWNSGVKRWGVKLKAVKNGTAVVSLKGTDGTIYASCQVIVTDLTEYYGVQIAGIEITNRNCQSVTGEGISGTVIYHPDTNTLTLNNAVLSRGGDGETFCVLLYNGRTGQTLSVELIGKNEIRDVSWAPYTGNSYVTSFSSSGGEALGSSEGNIFLKGGGSLKVQDSGTGTGVSCREFRIAEGTSLELEIGGGRNSIGIDANTVTIDGIFLSRQTATVDVTGIDASKLVIGKSGDVQISLKNSNGVTSLSMLGNDGIHLPWGGSAEISGKLKVSAFDEEDVRSGRGIAGSRSDQPSTVMVKESGQLEISADLDAFQYINLNLADGLVLNAGADKDSAFTKDSVYGENYVQIGKDLPVIPDPETVKEDSEKPGDSESSGNEKETEKESEKSTEKETEKESGEQKESEDQKEPEDPEDSGDQKGTEKENAANCAQHTYGKWKVTKKATYTAEGAKERTCSTCGYVEKASVAKLKIKAGAVLSDKTGSYKVLKGLKAVAFVSPAKKTAKSVSIPAAVKLAGKTFKVTKIQAEACSGYKKLTKVSIGKNVAEIGAKAFSGCQKLNTVTIGAGVKTIGKQAFSGCKALKKITITSKKLTAKKTGAKAFQGIFAKAEITVPADKVKAYRAILTKCGAGGKVKIKAAR